MRHPALHSLLGAACLAAGLLWAPAQAQQEITFSGGGSIGFGRIQKSSDTFSVDYNGNFMRSMGAQFLMKAKFGGNLQLSAGLGAVERHFLAGRITNSGGRTPFVISPYLVNANFLYSFRDAEDSKLQLTGGYFPFSYNPDVKNLGLYLTRGPVYPGFLISGFETKHTAPVANHLGFRLQHTAGGFEQNLIINSETEFYPLFDVSPIYTAAYSFGKVFRIGAGVNLYHLLPMDRRLTSPDTFDFFGSDINPLDKDPYSRSWIYVDTLAQDTTFLSFAGTKVMANASFDPKALFGTGPLGPNDLKLYAEVAVIGLDMDKAHKAVYGGYGERMPIMVGFNLPAFKLLDVLALEVEMYRAKFLDDLSRYQATTGAVVSPLPKVNRTGRDLTKDDLKWSLYGSRKFGQVRLAVQAANDHSRPGGQLFSPANEWQSFFADPKDWYWMTKIAFSF